MSDLVTIHAGGPTAAIPPATPPASTPRAKGESLAWQNEDFSFSDIVDVLNPLQHIPIVNRIYRTITGDEIGLAPKIAGGTLFGGVIGLVASLIDSAVEEKTGKDATEHLIAYLQSGSEDNEGMETETGTEVVNLDTPETDHNNVDDDIPAFIAQTTPFTRHTEAIPARSSTNTRISSINSQSNAQYGPAIPNHAPAAIPSPAQASPALMRRQTPTPGTTSLRPLNTSVPLHGVRGAPGVLPSPRAMAANPQLITTIRNNGAGVFAKAAPNMPRQDPVSVQKTPPGAWVEMMQAAKGSKPHGASGLASAAIAKAMAGYGAAGGALPLADIARAVRR
jgi:hypothetical protein